MIRKGKYNKHARWAAKEILKEIAKHIDENGNLDPKIGWEIKVMAQECKR